VEPQSKKIPNEEELVAQKKPHHLQNQSDAHFDEEKQQQPLTTALVSKEVNDYNKAKNDSNTVEAIAAEPSQQHLILKTGTAKTSEEEINKPISTRSTQSVHKQEPKQGSDNRIESQTEKIQIGKMVVT
jgi:hypothetical protein